MLWRKEKRPSAFLFSYDPDRMEEGGRRWYLPTGISDAEYRALMHQCQEEVGDRYVIMNSDERPDFLAVPVASRD